MTQTLTVEGTGFALDGAPFDMWGIRLANALETDAVATKVVGQLDSYLAYGVNTFSVFLQGAATGSANAFDADGSFGCRTRRGECPETLRGRGDVEGLIAHNQVLDRLAVLIEAADKRKMVVNVGVFYQARIDQFTDDAAIVRATENTARWLESKGYRNVFLDLVNEYGHGGFRRKPICFGRASKCAPDGGEELIETFKTAAPEIPVSISGAGGEPVIFPSADLFLCHAPYAPAEIRAQMGRELPVVLNEWGHGSISKDSTDFAGLYTEEECAQWQQTIRTMRDGGGFVFYHSQWKQYFTARGDPHFELGPEGAQPQDPRGGTPSEHWYFDIVKRERNS